ncbi:type II toxin-antitoxin system RelE/ParE family toxin [Prolixibacter sp. SD074]|jgi:phage-related protein|uniref:type II toxin-antitoxin system RelE/ParE family toxin n=1 Tax=Prolixibacter sp. SD074 TaxID=2652391 RepID=UPI0012778C5C|nr:type II toxin-antitoxin system RelE/ParE family toxin [Prolixibacter sp. SD074]GET27995.1 toxin RelE [Prolixibacter sp. SD074]
MIKYAIIFLELAKEFLDNLDDQTRKKVIYNIWKSRNVNDPELFKKLDGNIWEFRTKYMTKQIRLLAFWDKTEMEETLVVATHGFIKKTQKTPKSEIEKAEKIRKQYFKEKGEK